jgi:hypothetical protein
MTPDDIIHRNPFARAEYVGVHYAQPGDCPECGTPTPLHWHLAHDGGRRQRLGYWCSFSCLAGYHGIEADEWGGEE